LERRFDVMFSGRIVELKNPTFFAEVCTGIKDRLGHCRVLIIGEGEKSLKARMRQIFHQHGISCEFAGFIPHLALPEYYAQSRLLLLPTSRDCWGVVINEAMAAGTPVITTEWTAAAGELVLDQRNGYVLPLDVETWASAASELLSNQSKWKAFSQCALQTVQEFNFDKAANGILDAFAYLSGRHGSVKQQPSRLTQSETVTEKCASPFQGSQAGLLCPEQDPSVTDLPGSLGRRDQ
jgi:glycosyltransferase involved in cell wall biosynthesis